MKIAIIGGGLCGLSTAHNLINKSSQFNITLYDPLPIDSRASSMARLLHSFMNRRAKLNWMGKEALNAAVELLEEVQKSSTTTFYKKTKLLKLANDDSLIKPYKKSAEQDGVSFDANTLNNCPGLWIDEAYIVESKIYLEALHKLLLEKGLQYQNKLFNEEDKADYDLIIYTTGACPVTFEKLKTPAKLIKGQMIKIKKPNDWNVDHIVTAHKCHIMPSIDQKYLYIGNTFELHFDDGKPNIEVIEERLFPHIKKSLPNILTSDIIDIFSGVRLHAHGYLPIIEKIDHKTWLYTAMGSKGLLYHAYFAKRLIEELNLH